MEVEKLTRNLKNQIHKNQEYKLSTIKIKIKTTLVLILLNSFLMAQNRVNDSIGISYSRPDSLIAEFFKLYEGNEIENALNFIYGTNPWIKGEQEKIQKIKTNLSSILKLIGKYNGAELITTKSVGSNLVLYSYMLKYSRQPMRFNLIFYNPDKNWILLNFQYDDKLDEELIDAANIYRLYENLPQKGY